MTKAKTKSTNKVGYFERRKALREKAKTTAGISFWVDLRMGRLSKYTIQKRAKQAISLLFRYIILICLGFVILTPLLKLAKDALTDPSVISNKSSVWIPQKISTIFFEMGLTKYILNYWPSLAFTLVSTAVLTLLQVISTGLAAYAMARLHIKKTFHIGRIQFTINFNSVLYALMVFTIVVPTDCIMLAQFTTFRNFDFLGIIGAITGTGKGLNLSSSVVSMYILAATGMGVKSGLYIYIMIQAIRGLHYSVEEAAFVDGAGYLRTFFQIVVPSMSGSILTVSVLSFLWNYTDTYYTNLLNKANRASHLATHYSVLQANIRWDIANAAKSNEEWVNLINAENPYIQQAGISACSLLVVLPLLIMYLFVQKKFVEGYAQSGITGV